MTTRPTAGSSAAACATTKAPHVPHVFLRRVARNLLIRAAYNGRITWHTCFRMLALVDGGAL